METLEYRTLDRSSWGQGPWDNEPDKRQWQDRVTGLPCLVKRNRHGAWCGYVGVKEGHPLFGKNYDECHDINADLSVHGGLTYSAFCESESDPARGICHVDDDHLPVWWVGFDCLHSGDSAPARDEDGRIRFDFGCYKDLPYVESEVLQLARQLREMQPVATQ